MAGSAVLEERQFKGLVSLLEAERYDELERRARNFAKMFQDDGRVWHLLGLSFALRGQHGQAVRPLLRASQLMPRVPGVWDNLGLSLLNVGEHAQAERCFANAVAVEPKLFSAWLNRAANILRMGQPALAEQYAAQAIRLNPGHPAGFLSLANARIDLGEYVRAELDLKRARELAPGWLAVEVSRGVLYEKAGRPELAVECAQRVIERNPKDWQAFLNMGSAQLQQENFSGAVESYRQALNLQPQSAEVMSAYLAALVQLHGAHSAETVAEHRRCGEKIEAPFKESWSRHDNEADPERALRIGFVAADLRRDGLNEELGPYLEALAEDGQAVFMYTSHAAGGEVAASMSSVQAWHRQTELSDEALLGRIREDRIDILIDLLGHSAGNRLRVFARRAAPVQIAWRGYPATTGLTAIDYRFAAGSTLPEEGAEECFVEALVELPSAPKNRKKAGPSVGELRAFLPALRTTWQRWCEALPPENFTVKAPRATARSEAKPS